MSPHSAGLPYRIITCFNDSQHTVLKYVSNLYSYYKVVIGTQIPCNINCHNSLRLHRSNIDKQKWSNTTKIGVAKCDPDCIFVHYLLLKVNQVQINNRWDVWYEMKKYTFQIFIWNNFSKRTFQYFLMSNIVFWPLIYVWTFVCTTYSLIWLCFCMLPKTVYFDFNKFIVIVINVRLILQLNGRMPHLLSQTLFSFVVCCVSWTRSLCNILGEHMFLKGRNWAIMLVERGALRRGGFLKIKPVKWDANQRQQGHNRAARGCRGNLALIW